MRHVNKLGEFNLRKNTGRRFKNNNDNSKKYIFGRFIRDRQVLCIDHNNNNLGLIDTVEALQIARNENLELVMVSQGKKGFPSTCRILDFGKYKYEQEKKEKVAKRKQRDNAIKTKEVKFRPTTDDNDLKIKAQQLSEFLSEGNKVKVTVVFKGREIVHKDRGIDALHKFASMISGNFDGEISMTGRNLVAFIIAAPKEDQKTAAVG